jgi:hypothetical protein
MSRLADTTTARETSIAKAPWGFARTALTFMAAYLVWQPLAAYALAALLQDPAPLPTGAHWRAFLFCVAALGLLAGSLWWTAANLPHERKVLWVLRSTSRMLALVAMLNAARFASTSPTRWLVLVLGVSAVMGILFAWTER